MSAAPRSRPGADGGFGFIELLITSMVAALVIGGLMSMLTGMQFAHADLDSRTTAFQATRIGMDRIQRDLMLAGVGLTPMLPVFPLVIPRADGGLAVRYNQEGHTRLLRADMTNTRRVPMPAGHGFEVDDIVAVYDAAGSIELATVHAVNASQLQVRPQLDRKYLRSDGAAVARVVSVAYFVDTSGATPTLMRQVDAEPPSPVATDVSAFEVTFFDDNQPPEAFTPTTEVAQLRINMVDVRLEIRTPEARVQGGERPAFDLRTRITPRALAVSRR